ncbi:hypothetical protein NK718_04655 [Alsobacter sp. SYSU M60028]|uniref:Uncharacterized protein n=1 Tax=Alsobacter ponti TaxID=2962936 RepID=A0ABT1L8G8_9HYPH|nr:hypothetical protein [Alsobacter ponti]MCP8937795.1 hypothetical protein [Alsobacter ponti]
MTSHSLIPTNAFAVEKRHLIGKKLSDLEHDEGVKILGGSCLEVSGYKSCSFGLSLVQFDNENVILLDTDQEINVKDGEKSIIVDAVMVKGNSISYPLNCRDRANSKSLFVAYGKDKQGPALTWKLSPIYQAWRVDIHNRKLVPVNPKNVICEGGA